MSLQSYFDYNGRTESQHVDFWHVEFWLIYVPELHVSEIHVLRFSTPGLEGGGLNLSFVPKFHR